MDTYGDYLLRTAYLLLKDRQAAEEAVQDTFLTAFEKSSQLRDAQSIKSWLTTIVINRCRMKQRTWSWRNLFPSADTWRYIEEEGPDPEEKLLLKWRNGKLLEAIHRLDYIYKEALTLYYYNELTIKEIAACTKQNENTVKARLSRARMQLKKYWQEGELDHEHRQSSSEGTVGYRTGKHEIP
ncbi:sigma-70 family RNA polymerase sigma factor [Paenibacillaceae bacterium]|nr:sigma-70 family RNA polymerase sigma factor [Paenibacillaceae bacterium]